MKNERERREENTAPNVIMGRNAVREAIKKGRSIDRILIATGTQDGSIREIRNLAAQAKLIIKEVSRQKLDELCMDFGYGGRPGNHQGIVAIVPEKEYVTVEEILAYAREKGEEPFVILLDSIQDPHNLGAIIRSAECMGAHGVIIPKRRSAPLNAAASKASAGALEYMRVCKVTNLAATIEELKKQGLWIAGASMEGQPVFQCNLKGALAVVIGAEGDGLSRLLKEKCDFLVSIPINGMVDSLNASVAAGVMMYERLRQMQLEVE